MLTIHKVTNGNLETIGWAVIRDKREVVAEFEKVEDACKFAEENK